MVKKIFIMAIFKNPVTVNWVPTYYTCPCGGNITQKEEKRRDKIFSSGGRLDSTGLHPKTFYLPKFIRKNEFKCTECKEEFKTTQLLTKKPTPQITFSKKGECIVEWK